MPNEDPNHKFPATPLTPEKYEDPYETRRASILISLIPDGDGGRALDVGCGIGFYSDKLTNKGYRVTGIDTHPANIEKTSKVADETHLGNAISVLKGFEDERFDFVLMSEIIEHMTKEHAAEMLGEVYRVTRRNGHILASTPNRHSFEAFNGVVWEQWVRRWGKWMAWDNTHVHIYTASEARRTLESCGLIPVTMRGYWYRTRLKLTRNLNLSIGLPITSTTSWPLKYFGFNTMFLCRRD
jgi:2-polyprenyl-3-methyl-5-hydroxy-6-metoxy-1,4-benzoquinol methylase